ncbi:MAG: AI-2E family transporter [Chthoniobacterales bacterium]|nr:AI-2E family transporter [Chthoniobacterales bacterium]
MKSEFAAKVLFSVLLAAGCSPCCLGLEEQVARYSWGRKLLQHAQGTTQILPAPGDLLSQLGGVFTTAFGVLANVIIVLFIALFLAIDPQRYLDGTVRIFPKGGRTRVRELFTEAGEVLGWWLIGNSPP